MSDQTRTLAETILKKPAGKRRLFVAIAGPPASGKSKLSESLARELAQHTSVAVVPMDGFHYDNAILNDLNIIDRKGAPETFDAEGLRLLLQGLHQQTVPMTTPVFDRAQDLSRSSARMIQPEDHIILVEGNYLLCDTSPWISLHQFFDVTISLRVDRAMLEARLIRRWLDLGHNEEQARQRAASNDLPNADYVLAHSVAADFDIE